MKTANELRAEHEARMTAAHQRNVDECRRQAAIMRNYQRYGAFFAPWWLWAVALVLVLGPAFLAWLTGYGQP
jgi:hypothetical protein